MPAAPAPPQGRLVLLADLVVRRRRVVLVAWIVALLAAVAGAGLAGEWSADYSTPGSESRAAAELLGSAFPGRSQDTVDVVWQAPDAGVTAVRKRIDALAGSAARLEGIGRGASSEADISPDGTVAVLRLPLTELPGAVPPATGEALLGLAQRADGDGLRVELDGQVIADAQQGDVSSEMVGLLIAAGVLVLTFGSLVAAGPPLATALFGLGISSTLVGGLAALTDVPDWAPALASMLGIGVGIDYALLIVTRYRAALAGGRAPADSVREAVATAGRSVLIAGTTVVISLLGLFLMGLPYLYGAALASIAAVLVVMAAAVTLVPALLAMAGTRIDRLSVPGTRRAAPAPETAPAARWSRAVQRRPWIAALAGTAVLLALAAPLTGLHLGFPDRGNDALDTTTRQAYDLVAQAFGPGANGPLVLVAPLDGGAAEREAVGRLAARLADAPGVAGVGRPALSPGGEAMALTVIPDSTPQDPATEALVDRLRDDVLPGAGIPVLVGGATAAFVDQSATTAARLPLFIGGVVGLAFLLLLVSFRSVVVALKAAAMNLLSIGAAYGIIALLADGGWAGQLIGIDTPTPVPPFIPVIMFAVLFGLSMDYEVFLLSRVREEFLAGRSTPEAVTEGLARTARVITAAALIMVAVFGAFVLSPEVFLKLIGAGLAAAILIDATVVRMVLVPAVMQLLGERNWWMPSWLDRALPDTAVEGRVPAPAA